MIKVINLCKSYGGQELFEDATFNINPKERVGLVGRNGHGKTTLFRLILGQETADSGNIGKPKSYRIGYLEQHLNFTQSTILEEACLGLPEGEEFNAWKAEKILAGLGFSAEDMQRPPAEFSGGFQVRLNLAKVLVSEPDLLLLDEPTNYLDIISIRWLTNFLRNWKSELMLITHDRGFMDSVTTHTLGIHRRRMRKFEGNTDKYYEQIASEEEIYEKTRLNDEKKRKEVELFIRRFRAKARLANMVQSRIKTLQKQETKSRLEQIDTLEFSFNTAPFSAKIMMDAQDVSFKYEGQRENLFSGVNLTVARDDRICIVGKNGKGKTTLLKVLAETLQPKAGEIKKHPSLQTAFFEQTNTAHLDPNKTIEDEILRSSADCTNQKARDVAGAMMFSGDAALKKISVLSGGEKSRVLLGKLLVSPSHLLLLDEPTNHLDMESSDSLMAAIDAFDGAVILVTHNEMFLHTLANRLIVFDRGKQFVFEGSYQRFLEDVGWESDEEDRPNAAVRTISEPAPLPVDKKALKKKKAELIQKKSRVLRPLEQKIAELESKIEECEVEIATLNKKMVEASSNGHSTEIVELSKSEAALRKDVQVLYDQLEQKMEELDAKTADFDEKLESLG